VEEGLFFDGIHMLGDQLPIHQAGQDPIAVFPDAADAPSAAFDDASVLAQIASDLERTQAFV
jgi:hypothetical protein